MNRKTILITGAAKGIGEAIARKFASLEYNVLVNYNTSEKKALSLKEELLEKGYNVDIYKADVSKREEVNNMISYCLKRFDTLDVVINNSGICEYKLFTDITNSDIEKMLSTTVIGTFNVTQEALNKYMINKKNGVIINISSIWGMVGASCEVNYSTAKAGIIGMTKALAKELGMSNIRVNAIAPGCIDTDMLSGLSLDTINSLKEEIPLGKIGKVEDIANTAAFLASEEASYITGQVISPNGGMVI